MLALRDNSEHMAAAAEHEIEFIDLIAVNLYPFERTAGRASASDHEVIENIDIGGPTMIRAAAKNYPFVAVVTTPESYAAILAALRSSDARLSLPPRASRSRLNPRPPSSCRRRWRNRDRGAPARALPEHGRRARGRRVDARELAPQRRPARARMRRL